MSRFKVPKQIINFLVDKFHVGTPDEAIAADIRRRCEAALFNDEKLTSKQVEACVIYAVEHHHKNQDFYSFVMRGR